MNMFLSKTLLFHLFLTVILQGVCLGIIGYCCSCTVALVLGVFLLLETIFFVCKALDPIVKIERKIDELKRSNRDNICDGAEDKEYPAGMLETIQLLLQKEAAANIMKKQAEIDALQNQINPHFLYNTMETIRGQAICCGAAEIAETAKALADIFRFNINKKGSMIYLYEELSNIDAYMKIQKIRFSDKFELKKELDEALMNLKVPKLLIQPLVENALKHGLEMKRGKGRIVIKGFRTEDTLFISVADDGVGMSLTELDILNKRLVGDNQAELINGISTKVGLVNINDRVKMLYGSKYGIIVRSVQNVGTEVTVMLGINKD